MTAVSIQIVVMGAAVVVVVLILTVFGRGVVVVDVVVVVGVEEGSVMSPGKTTGTGRLTGRTWPR